MTAALPFTSALVTGASSGIGEAMVEALSAAGVPTVAVARRAEIAQCLIAQGRDPNEPVAFIENGTTPRERVIVTTLEQVAAGQSEVTSPAVMVAGPVVQLRAELLAVVQSVAA